jgi:hypothetical protein
VSKVTLPSCRKNATYTEDEKQLLWVVLQKDSSKKGQRNSPSYNWQRIWISYQQYAKRAHIVHGGKYKLFQREHDMFISWAKKRVREGVDALLRHADDQPIIPDTPVDDCFLTEDMNLHTPLVEVHQFDPDGNLLYMTMKAASELTAEDVKLPSNIAAELSLQTFRRYHPNINL